MSRAGLWLGAMCLVGELAGCSSKGVFYPEDHARFKRIDEAMETLRIGYEQKDLGQIKGVLLPLDPVERMETDIQRDFQAFEEISVTFSIERIVIEEEAIDVFVHWQGEWRKKAGEPGTRERGHGVLHWVGVQSILLRGIEGDLPFGMSARLSAAEPQKDAVPAGAARKDPLKLDEEGRKP